MSDLDQGMPLCGNDPQGPPQLNMANCCCNCRCRGLGGSDEGDSNGDIDPDKSFMGGSEGIERPPSAASQHIFYTGLCPGCEEDQNRLGKYRAIRPTPHGFEYVRGVDGFSDEAASQTGRREPAVEDGSNTPEVMGTPSGSGTESRVAGWRSDTGSDVVRCTGTWTIPPPPNNTPYYFSPTSPPLALTPYMRIPTAMVRDQQLGGIDFALSSPYPLEIAADDCHWDRGLAELA